MNGRNGYFIRRMLALMLTALVFSTAMACAEGDIIASGKIRGSEWQLTADGALYVPAESVYISNRADVPWYDYMDQIRTAEIADGMDEIFHYMFNEASQLTDVTIPEGVETIGLSAFSGCVNLKAVWLPSTLRSIDYWAFADCDSLEEVVLGGQLEVLSNYVFQNCDGLRRVVIQEPVRRLGYDCLEHCPGLRELYLPATLEIIDRYALNECTSLSDIYFAGTYEQWQAIDKTDNIDVLRQTRLHCNTTYDPETATPLEELTPESRSAWQLSTKGVYILPYVKEDHYMFLSGQLDEKEEEMQEAGLSREEVESLLTNRIALFFPKETGWAEARKAFFVEVHRSWSESALTLKEMREQDPLEWERIIEELESHSWVVDSDYEMIGNHEFAVLSSENEMHYSTIMNGFLVDFRLWFDPDDAKEEAKVYLRQTLEYLMVDESLPVEMPQEEQPADDPGREGKKAYSLMNGKLTAYLSEDEYNVLLADNSNNAPTLERLGIGAEDADIYLNLLSLELMAVPAGGSLLDAEYDIRVKVKDPEYADIGNLKNLNENELNIMAAALLAGFGGASDYELYHTDDAVYIVFEWGKEIRYATIAEDRMIYMILSAQDGNITDEHRQRMRETVDAMEWNL